MSKLEQSISNLAMYRANNSNYDEELANDIDVVLQALENSIPKDVIENKLKELEKQYIEALDENSTKAFILKCQIEVCKELINLQSNKKIQ